MSPPGLPLMCPRGGDGSYFPSDIHSITGIVLRSGTDLESGEPVVIIEITLGEGDEQERYSYSMPTPHAREFAEVLARYVEDDDSEAI